MTKLKTIGTKAVAKEEIKSEITEDYLKLVASSMPAGKRNALIDATDRYRWEELGTGINEKARFDNLYSNASLVVFEELGPRALRPFSKYKDLVEAAALHLIKNEGDGVFAGTNASGATEYTLRVINADTFDLSASDRIYSVSAGVNDLIPTGAGSYSTTKNKQSIIIFGYSQTMNARIPEVVQEELGDSEGVRLPTDLQQNKIGDVNVKKTNSGPRWVQNDSNINIDISCTQSGNIDVFPLGIEICAADQISSLI